MRTVSLVAEGVDSMDIGPCSITMTSRDTSAMSPLVCPTDGSDRVVSSCGVAITPGHDPSIAGASTFV
jgi:hypothetical protein